MWTPKTRGRIAAIEKKTKRYPTDLTDAEWEHVRPLLPRPAKHGRKPKVDLREVLNAIRYMTRTGGGWRMLPKVFRPGTRSTGGSGGSCGCCCSAPSTISR